MASCFGHRAEVLSKKWFNSEEGKLYQKKVLIETTIETVKDILRELGYIDVHNTTPIPGEEEHLIGGDYEGNDGFTYGVCLSYFNREKGERIEISSVEKKRAEEIEREIKRNFPKIDCKLRNSC